MKKNGILTLLFAFIPGAGQMYQGYMKRGLSLVLMAAAICMASALIPRIVVVLLVVFMYSFFDTFHLRAQISMGTAPEDDYLALGPEGSGMAGHLSGDGSTARGGALRGTDPVRHLAGAWAQSKESCPGSRPGGDRFSGVSA